MSIYEQILIQQGIAFMMSALRIMIKNPQSVANMKSILTDIRDGLNILLASMDTPKPQ